MDRALFDGIVAELTAAAPAGVQMTALIVDGPEGTFRHDFTDGAGAPLPIRSISKVVVALAVGAAIAAGTEVRGRRLSLDLEIWPFFADLADRQAPRGRAHLRAVRLRHLLTNTMGHDEGFLFRADLAERDLGSLLPHVFARELVHPPGSHFAYSNAGWFLISALVRDALGTSLRDWAAAHVLRPLGIGDVTWATYGRYEAGATGLFLSAAEVLAIGRLLLDDGRHRGRQVVPRGWVEAMRTPAVPAPGGYDPPLRATGYGYGLWTCDGGVSYCAGADGQFLILVPERRTVVVALAEAGELPVVARCLGPAIRAGTRRERYRGTGSS